jgi:uncharacterized membrane protein YqhA
MSIVVVISQHLLNVFVQLANKRGFKKKKLTTRYWLLVAVFTVQACTSQEAHSVSIK